jgi:flagellar protein FliJ
MTDRFPLQTVLELMQTRADDAAKELGRLISLEKDARARIKLLEDYRVEYAARFRTTAENGITPSQWANFQDFLAKLDDAIRQQQQIVDASANRTAEGKERWLHQRNRVQAFDQLAQKHEATVRYRDNRREQKLVDEFASRQHTSKTDES